MEPTTFDWKTLTDLSHLNLTDYALLSILIFSTLISLVRGFLREAISLATWVLAFWISLTFGHWLSTYLERWIHHPMLRKVSAILILLIGTILMGMCVAHAVECLIKKGKLSTLDRLLGVCFGAIRGVLIIGLLLFLGHLLTLDQTQWWKTSQYIPLFKTPVEWIKTTVPSQIQELYSLVIPKDESMVQVAQHTTAFES